jgi:hypothetical protein
MRQMLHLSTCALHAASKALIASRPPHRDNGVESVKGELHVGVEVCNGSRQHEADSLAHGAHASASHQHYAPPNPVR